MLALNARSPTPDRVEDVCLSELSPLRQTKWAVEIARCEATPPEENMTDRQIEPPAARLAQPGSTPSPLDDVIGLYGLELLKSGGDFSIENGDLALTKDGDIKLGNTIFNALFRFAETWRLNAPHLRFLFDLAAAMHIRRGSLDDKMDRIGEERHTRFDIKTYPANDQEFITAFHEVIDEQRAADHGIVTYGGCVVIILSGSLLRFKNDLDATGDDWNKAAPIFNGCSIGQVIVAAVNGYRHDDEWAKTRPSTPQQRASQQILELALPAASASYERAPGRCPEVLDTLSAGGDFDRLATNVFTFVHNVAVRRNAALGIR